MLCTLVSMEFELNVTGRPTSSWWTTRIFGCTHVGLCGRMVSTHTWRSHGMLVRSSSNEAHSSTSGYPPLLNRRASERSSAPKLPKVVPEAFRRLSRQPGSVGLTQLKTASTTWWLSV